MKIEIDTTVWTRPTMYAEKNGLTPQMVSNQIAKGILQVRYIRELRLTLVKKNAT